MLSADMSYRSFSDSAASRSANNGVIMKQREIKEKRLEYLLDRMKSEPMNCHQMADLLCCHIKCAQKYIFTN